MNNKFQYALLQFRPSIFLDERINVGILFFFQNERKLQFIYPDCLDRVAGCYPTTNIQYLAQYLAHIKRIAETSETEFDDVDQIISNFFFPTGSESLFFSHPRTGTYNYKSVDDIVSYYTNAVFHIDHQNTQNTQYNDF